MTEPEKCKLCGRKPVIELANRKVYIICSGDLERSNHTVLVLGKTKPETIRRWNKLMGKK